MCQLDCVAHLVAALALHPASPFGVGGPPLQIRTGASIAAPLDRTPSHSDALPSAHAHAFDPSSEAGSAEHCSSAPSLPAPCHTRGAHRDGSPLLPPPLHLLPLPPQLSTSLRPLPTTPLRPPSPMEACAPRCVPMHCGTVGRGR